MESNIIPSMKDTLFNPVSENMKDSLIEIAELGLDAVLRDGVLKDIPILGTIAALCKTGVALQERNLIRQTAVFITSFNDGTIPQEKLIEYRQALESNPKKAEKELGRVMLLLERILEEKQSHILGRFYNAYVRGALTWGKFVELSEVNLRMFLSDYKELESINRKPIEQREDVSDRRLYKIQRLESLGLVMENSTRLFEGNTLSYSNSEYRFNTTPLGGTFVSMMR